MNFTKMCKRNLLNILIKYSYTLVLILIKVADYSLLVDQFRIILYPTLFNDSVACYITLSIYLNHHKIDIIIIPLINILNYSIVFEASTHVSFFNFHLFNYYFVQQSKFNFLTNHVVL